MHPRCRHRRPQTIVRLLDNLDTVLSRPAAIVVASKGDCDVRKVFVAMLVATPLIAACGRAEEPLVPELKGRWDVMSKFKSDHTVGMSSRVEPVRTEGCRVGYITFSKRKIAMHMMGVPLPVFYVAEAKRDGQRLILTGGMDPDKNARPQGKLVLLLRNGEVRFDDIFDEGGRSVKYDRIPDGHPMRSRGATTLGEAMGLVLDVKQCSA